MEVLVLSWWPQMSWGVGVLQMASGEVDGNIHQGELNISSSFMGHVFL